MMKLPINYEKARWPERKEAREAYVLEQNGLCYFCKKPLANEPNRDLPVKLQLYPQGFFDNPVHLHHDHITGMTLGAVHCYCNAVLWEYHGE
jgi:hypothetical protein